MKIGDGSDVGSVLFSLNKSGGACCLPNGTCVDNYSGTLPVGYNPLTSTLSFASVTCEDCYGYLCSPLPGILYYVKDCGDCDGGYCDPVGSPWPCGTLHPGGDCSGNPCG